MVLDGEGAKSLVTLNGRRRRGQRGHRRSCSSLMLAARRMRADERDIAACREEAWHGI